jgi:hypothetical protein
MDLAWLVLSLNRGRGKFLNFLCAPMISRLMRVCVGRVLSPGFLAFNWSAGFGPFLQVSALASHWLEDCANFTPTQEENDQYSANHS